MKSEMDKETVKRLMIEAALRVPLERFCAEQEVCYEAFAKSCCDWQKEQCGDALSDALQSDLEHGVKCLNENASREFHEKYPALIAAIIQINASPEDDIEQARGIQ